MFLRCKVRRKDGKQHRYWSVVENTRTARGRVVQRHVLYLGEINDTQELAWRRSNKHDRYPPPASGVNTGRAGSIEGTRSSNPASSSGESTANLTTSVVARISWGPQMPGVGQGQNTLRPRRCWDRSGAGPVASRQTCSGHARHRVAARRGQLRGAANGADARQELPCLRGLLAGPPAPVLAETPRPPPQGRRRAGARGDIPMLGAATAEAGASTASKIRGLL
jgi:hypothetical protein